MLCCSSSTCPLVVDIAVVIACASGCALGGIPEVSRSTVALLQTTSLLSTLCAYVCWLGGVAAPLFSPLASAPLGAKLSKTSS